MIIIYFGYIVGIIWAIMIIASIICQLLQTEECNYVTGKTLVIGLFLAIIQSSHANQANQEVVSCILAVDAVLLIMMFIGVANKILFQA